MAVHEGEVQAKKGGPFSTMLMKVNETYFPMIERQLSGYNIQMEPYAKQCVMNAMSAIHNVLQTANVQWSDTQLDQSNLTEILISIASLQLNAAASPREVYFSIRNVSIKKGKDGNGQDIVEWKKKIEMGIEGDGNDAILARYGRGIKKVGQFWLVRQGDEFEYPVYTGFDVTPPKWTPKGVGDVVRVVYPVLKSDDTVEYHIAERADCLKNLIAHMNQNMMWETFDIIAYPKKKVDATWEQKKQIEAKRAAVLKQVKEAGLEAALDHADFQKWISPAWTEGHSREGMLIRKMRNNAVKKIPKDFRNSFIEMVHDQVMDAEFTEIRQEIAQNANTEPIDIKTEPVPEEAAPEHADATDPDERASEAGEPIAQEVMDFEKNQAAETAAPAGGAAAGSKSRRGF